MVSFIGTYKLLIYGVLTFRDGLLCLREVASVKDYIVADRKCAAM